MIPFLSFLNKLSDSIIRTRNETIIPGLKNAPPSSPLTSKIRVYDVVRVSLNLFTRRFERAPTKTTQDTKTRVHLLLRPHPNGAKRY